jgi:hypothetical protein
MIQGLTDKLTMKKKFIEDEDKIEEHMENMPSDLKKLHGVLTFKKREPEPGVGNQPRESWFLSWLVGFLVGFWLVFLTNHHQPRIFEVGFLVGWFGWLVFRQFLLFFWF